MGAAWMPPEAGEDTRLIARWLRGTELQRLQRFKVASARRDFLAGRAAAKLALTASAAATSPADWEIATGAHGEPETLPEGPGADLRVTLAHTSGRGLALAFNRTDRWGIDLEPVARDASDAIRTQVSPSEARWAEAGAAEAPGRWLLLWTAREALGKCHGTGLLKPEVLLPSVEWESDGRTWKARFADGGGFLVRAVVAGGFVASVVFANLERETAAGDAVIAWIRQALIEFAE